METVTKKFPLAKSPKKEYIGDLYEYDIEAAGFHIFINDIADIFASKLPEERIKEVQLAENNKLLRNKLIGKVQRDFPEIKAYFTIYFRLYLENFVNLNGLILEKNVIRTTKDSIIVNKKCNILSLNDYINFRLIGYYNELILFKDGNGRTNEVYLSAENEEEILIKGSNIFTQKWKGLFSFFKTVAFTKRISNKLERYAKVKFFLDMFERDSLRFIRPEDTVTVCLEKLNLELEFKNVPIEYLKNISVNDFKNRFLLPFADKLLKE